jgi:hypothetical protein
MVQPCVVLPPRSAVLMGSLVSQVQFITGVSKKSQISKVLVYSEQIARVSSGGRHVLREPFLLDAEKKKAHRFLRWARQF